MGYAEGLAALVEFETSFISAEGEAGGKYVDLRVALETGKCG